MATIMEVLQTAEENFNTAARISRTGYAAELMHAVAMEQLHNAITLLEKGYGLYDDMDPALKRYPRVEDVPEKGGE